MGGSSAVATRSILPGSPSERQYVLIGAGDEPEPKRVDLAELLNLWDHCEGLDISWFPQDLHSDAETNRRESIASLRYVVVDLDFRLAGREFGTDELLDELERLGLPNPTMVVFTGGGFHVYWSIGNLYIGRKSRESISDARKRHEYWCSRYERVTTCLCLSLSDYGADRQATSVTHLFRLPGSYSPKHGVPVEIVHRDDEAETSLDVLSETLEALGLEIQPDSAEPSASREREHSRPARCRTLDTAAIKWLLNHRIVEGSRFAATFPVIQACLFSGLGEEETRRFVLKWNESKCAPPRSEREIDNEIKACWRRHSDGNPQGISPGRLMEIQSIDGSTMDRATALTVFQGLPRGTDFPERERNHKKRRGSSEQALDLCIALIKCREISGRMTDKEVADRLKVSVSMFKKSVKPRLKEQGFCSTTLHQVPRATTYAPPARPPLSTTYETEGPKNQPCSDMGLRPVDEGEMNDVREPGALAGAMQNPSRSYETRRSD